MKWRINEADFATVKHFNNQLSLPKTWLSVIYGEVNFRIRFSLIGLFVADLKIGIFLRAQVVWVQASSEPSKRTQIQALNTFFLLEIRHHLAYINLGGPSSKLSTVEAVF